jgi:hypothetical protein
MRIYRGLVPLAISQLRLLSYVPQPNPAMSFKPEPVTPGTVLYWLGLAVLLIGVVTVIWNVVVNPPAGI